MGASRKEASPDLRALGGTGLGTFVYGPDRPTLLHVAFALAKVNDPNPYWIDLRGAERQGELGDPVGLGRIPDDHVYVVSAMDARPEDAEANMALWTVVRSDEPKSLTTTFIDFLRLPRPVQEAVSRSKADGRRPIFVIANSDLVRSYYPAAAAGVRPIIDAMLRAGVDPHFRGGGTSGRRSVGLRLRIRDPTGSGPDRRRGSSSANELRRDFPSLRGRSSRSPPSRASSRNWTRVDPSRYSGGRRVPPGGGGRSVGVGTKRAYF